MNYSRLMPSIRRVFGHETVIFIYFLLLLFFVRFIYYYHTNFFSYSTVTLQLYLERVLNLEHQFRLVYLFYVLNIISINHIGDGIELFDPPIKSINHCSTCRFVDWFRCFFKFSKRNIQ